MSLYVIPRTRAWLSEEELAAAAECVPAVNAALAGHVRWIRTYVVQEPDGTLGAFCVYEATAPESLRRHAADLRLPVDAIEPVHVALLADPDPEPAGTAS